MNFLFGSFYYYSLIAMIILAVIIFIVLQFITPAYGMTFNNRWGMSVKNKMGWLIMESPVFVAMTFLYLYSLKNGIKPFNWVTFSIFVFFQLHYFQRSFVFPPLMRGSSKMPISIIAMGFFFNTMNAYMQGGWLFYVCPEIQYEISWFWSVPFIIGTILFFLGMVINMHADRIIRALRKDKNDNNYYIPHGFLFNKISSANYFGEILEWVGFAILSWSPSGLVFVLWSFANIVPRSKAVYERYIQFFGDDFKKLKRNKIFPYIY
jgi:3-oxo-5-alpha-steroid 4-dehydrogenase 1